LHERVDNEVELIPGLNKGVSTGHMIGYFAKLHCVYSRRGDRSRTCSIV